MEIPKIGTGFKALMVAGVLQDEGAMGAATAVLAAGVGKKIFGGLFKKKQEDTLERKFEKVLDERKRLFEKNLPESSILGKTKLIIKKIKEGLSKFLTAVLAALKTIFAIIKTALITVAKALLALVKWIGKKLLRGLLKSLMKLCKSGGFRKMKARIKVFGRKLKRFIKSPAALLIGGIALGMAGYFSAIFKKEKKEIDEIGGEDDEKDTSVSEEAPAKTEEPSKEAPTKTEEPPAPQAAPPAGAPVPAPQAAPPRAAGAPVPAATSTGKVPTTIEEIKAFQKANGLTADGIAGQMTIDLMIKQGLYPTEDGARGMILKELNAKGIVSPAAIANIFATIYEESKFRSVSEIISEENANKRYGGMQGNDQPGDGFKYRGRGFIQHTHKAQYIALSKYMNIDLVNNPDLLLDPKIAAKAIPWFYLVEKGYMIKKISDLDDMSTVNRATGFQGSQDPQGAKSQARILLAKQYLQAGQVGGTKLAATGEMGQVTSGTALASAGQTQYDKDKNSKTNVVIVPKANNKTNNIEESRKAA